MDKVATYKKIVRKLMYEFAERSKSSRAEIQTFVVEDAPKGQYLLFKDGWTNESSRFYGCSIHVGVNAQGRVYLYYDMTEFEVGQRLLDSGVAAEDLVPAFQPPSVRKEMGFAVA